MRNLESYTGDYLDLPFERIQELYRRRAIIEYINHNLQNKILEVGCGLNPIFTSLDETYHVTVVEPSKTLFDLALIKSKDYKNSTVINATVEEIDFIDEFDLIIVSSILHEVIDKSKFMKKILSLSGKGTDIYINVPNAKSFHRLLAVSMGLIKDEDEISETQIKMQQISKPFTIESLKDFIERSGFVVTNYGTIFVKPFTHIQMQNLCDNLFINEQVLDGLNKLTRFLPDLGSEIWMSAKRR